MASPSPAESSARKQAKAGQFESEERSSDAEERAVEALDPFRTLNINPSQIINVSGFSLHYDNETPLRQIDYGGPDQQLKMAEFVSKSIDNLSHGITVNRALEKLKLSDMKDLLPGLEVRLMAHQVIGVSWMLDQERVSQYKGGILADDMGLGKTVQMIATMVVNLPDMDARHRSTLIVVPAALLQQWKDEIETKSNEMFKVHIHHGPHKLKTMHALEDIDVVITTYQTLNTDFAIPEDVDSFDEKEWLVNNGGLLARAKWFRVVLDEAQFVRNRKTQSSRSVAYLRSTYRWLLTGTPVTNTLADIYGLLRFGQFRPWNDWDSFNEYIAKTQIEDPPLAGLRAQGILQPLMLRRTKNSTLEGEPIIKLPPKSIELVTLDFSAEERDVYDSFERRSKIQLNRFIRNHSIMKNHAIILVMILRMRQLCCHPNLILSRADEFENPTDMLGDEAEKEVARAFKIMGPAWVANVKQRFMKRALALEAGDFADEADEPEASCPVCKDLFMNDSGRILACGHEICFDCTLELTGAAIAHDNDFGNGTEQENAKAEKAYESAAAKGHRPCPTCKKMNDLSTPKTFKSAAFEPSEEDVYNAARDKRKQRLGKKRGAGSASRSKVKHEDSDDMEEPKQVVKRRFTGLPADLDDSSDEMPDLSIKDLFAERDAKKEAKKVVKKEVSKVKAEGKKRLKKKRKLVIPPSDDETVDITMGDISAPLSNPLASGAKNGRNDTDSDVEVLDDPPSSQVSRKSKGKRKARADEASEDDDDEGEVATGTGNMPTEAVFAAWRKGDDDLEPSTKMMGLIDLLKEWDATGDKTICYSQWTSMLDLIEKLFGRYGIRSLRYDGSMDRHAREVALSTFKRAGGPKVILISTRCGGVGLNLVSANRIINMDLSWNYASESQAYDRVHRLGQDKDVIVKRLVVRNTIEERMLELQDVKVGLSEAALGEGNGGRLHKLSVKQLKSLFGMGPKKDDKDPNQSNVDPHLRSSIQRRI
ncbi:hypothetical protein FIBSPDRAFT_917816 [Athelia psychrophila]|uniref:P-loop containing nucleoside triphosphate hydrolase protein n=1 Tax=Athelia psychrophila TaxID=1759441 RepID=A0A166R6Z1_9AGAM|nr:hypothetical protein FIBSPDRAFT_917816 [Fibularhizoctonia sp. CBS 109695]